MHTLAQLELFDEEIREKALAASDAAEALERVANGAASSIMPAPTAYAVLGEMKVLLTRLKGVAEFARQGLPRSLRDDRIVVVDRHFMTGEVRDPAAQVELATTQLRYLAAALITGIEACENAQQALNSQGYEPA